MILRKFKSEGDVELAQQLVFDSNGIQRARDLAAEHASLAAQAVSHTLMCIHSCIKISLPAFPFDTFGKRPTLASHIAICSIRVSQGQCMICCLISLVNV